MKKLVIVSLILVFFASVSCTENFKVKKMGGKMKVELPVGKKLVNVTWKEDNMWVLTRDRHEDEKVDTFTFKEKSSMGVMEGTIIFIEK